MALHAQLERLWATGEGLSIALEEGLPEARLTGSVARLADPQKNDSNHHNWFFVPLLGYEFVPLVTRRSGFICELAIKFLRRGRPGDVVGNGGDLDNRIKVPFDALRTPHSESEVFNPADTPPQRVFCVLEDDSLIKKFSVDSGTLLAPAGSDSDVDLQIDVNARWEMF
jgi:hypothetical protein